MVGTIQDKDGFVNVRKEASSTSEITGKLTTQEYFFYIPNSTKDWLEVSRKDDQKAIIGFVHKSRIRTFDSMPDNLKKKVIKDRKGC